MALKFPTTNTDFVQRTAESRKITKTLVGDFTFDLFNDQHRNKVFLPRNMTRVLAFHDRNRIRSLQTGTYRSSSSRSRGPFLNPSAARSNSADEGSVPHMTDRSEPHVNGLLVSDSRDVTEAKPDVESMSQDCLKVRIKNGSIEEQARDKRRSIRHQLSRQHEDKNAQLYLDFVNIRKKLNFKESVVDDETRPRKRVRRETVACHAHVTIWDNRNSIEKEPIVRKSEICDVSTSEMGAAGLVAEIKLQNPFIFKASELKVPLKTSEGNVWGIADNYFLEIKIIPTRSDAAWPPIPVLGRSEGDQIAGIARLVAEKLEDSLLMRYYHLPQAPPPDVPLSVFYLHEGSTYRSKYGLEVNAIWTKGDVPETMMKREDDDSQMDLWAVDEGGHLLGAKAALSTNEIQSRSNSRTRAKQRKSAATSVKITFNIDAASAKGAKDFRKATLTGLRCPACPGNTFDAVDDLQFHFTTCHSKYRFTLEKQEYDPVGDALLSVVFKISSVTATRTRNQDREPRKGDRDLRWQAPAEPLDVHGYVNGDQDWVEQNWIEGLPKKTDPVTSSITVVSDNLSSIRQRQHAGFEPGQKGGFLPAEHVADFRRPNRTKYPNIKLKTLTADKEMMYTSISHRQIQVGEEARSESDDEMDDGWFIQKSLEALDMAAEKHEWTDEQRMLRRKWNQRRLSEKLSHPRYLSDCLIRFVRSERDWLNSGDVERKLAFAEFLDEFLQRRVINQEVTRDIWMILHKSEEDESHNPYLKSRPHHHGSAVDVNSTLDGVSIPHSSAQEAETVLQLPPYTCAVCWKPIAELRRQGLRCSEHECEAPNIWYHTGCVRCKRKDKLSWKCGLCTERIEKTVEAQRAKGKDTGM